MNSPNQRFPENGSESTSSFPVQGPSGDHPIGQSAYFQGGNNGAGSRNPFLKSQQTPGRQPAAASGYPVAPRAQAKSNNALILILIVVLLLLMVVVGGVFFALRQGSDDSFASGSPGGSGYGQGSAEQGRDSLQQQGDGSGDLGTNRAEDFQAPASWDFCDGSGSPGNLNLVYTATEVTSCPFARNVRDAYVRQYLSTGNLNASVEASSPVTHKAYTMRCSDDGTTVTCRGGNNAVVVIV